MSGIDWTFVQLRPDAAGFWLLVDVLAGLCLWLFADRLPQRWHALSSAARWVLPAYLALLTGAMAPQQMGLTGINWDTGLRVGLGYMVAILALLTFARIAARGGQPAVREAQPTVGQTQPAAEDEQSTGGLVFGILYRGCEQFHWCFQRAAVLSIFMAWPSATAGAFYWALWVAALLPLPGVLMSPGVTQRIYGAVALVTTAILFFYTRNFWLCWALHTGILLIGGALEAATAPDAARNAAMRPGEPAT